MATCCGREVTTPFCPMCGRKHTTTPAELTLLRHLQDRAALAKPAHKARWDAWVAWVAEHLAPPTADAPPKKEAKP